jgi:hypothetical protein
MINKLNCISFIMNRFNDEYQKGGLYENDKVKKLINIDLDVKLMRHTRLI